MPQLSVSQINNSFTAMATLKPLAAKGKGNVAVILPDTVSSTRYVEFDAPYLKESFAKAGLKSSQYTVQNALGSDSTQFSDAQTAITKGASVLLVDPLDSGVGAHIESYAKAHGVAVIDYDRLTLGGTRKYYVSFNNVVVGQKMGQGLVACTSAWKVKKPQVIVMKGAPTDNNATLFAQGYDAVLKPHFSSGLWKDVSNPAGTWDPPTALSEFQQQFTAHSNINAALIPNDENAAPIIHYLQNKGDQAQDVPDHRPGRHADRPAEHPGRLPVRHRVQADLPGGPGGRRPGHVRPGRGHRAGQPAERQDPGSADQDPGGLGAADSYLGDHRQHEQHRDRGQVRARLAAVLGQVLRGVQGRRDLRLRKAGHVSSWDIGRDQ